MTAERRGEQGLRGPFEATWSGSSGHRALRVLDSVSQVLSLRTLLRLLPGARVTITLRVPGGDPTEAGETCGVCRPSARIRRGV